MNRTTVKMAEYFLLFFMIATMLRLATTADVVQWGMLNGYTVIFALVFTLVCALYDFSTYHLFLCLAFIGVYLLGVALKYLTNSVVSEREILYTAGFGVLAYALPALLLYVSGCVAKKPFRKILKVSASVVLMIFVLPPLIYAGYFIASEKHFLQADSILALFQTNFSEISAYLAEQNLWLWTVGSAFILLTAGLFTVGFMRLKISSAEKTKTAIVLSLVLIYSALCVLPKLNQTFVLRIGAGIYETLKSFKAYEEGKEERMARLASLKNFLRSDDEKGIYVVIMGESTTRKHMSAFGYERPTTPWLEKMKNDEKAILFENAYSSHAHTVPTVQNAFSSKNQYQEKEVSKTYSITEIARAAGFETYWISNQERFVKADIPISVIAQAADHQRYINEHVGSKIMSTYYDDELVKFFPKIKTAQKTLIIFHLMGCHAMYKDRYPKSFNFFDGKNKKTNEYDNAVAFNDFVISKIYERAKQEENFMGLIYLSDHGEDPDNGNAHDGSKFVYQMSQIPLVMIFSDKWKEKHKDIYLQLQKNKDKYWTSDLFYDMIVHVMGIKNVPDRVEKMDISSPKYDMPVEILTTLEGQKHIKDSLKAN
ncbi:MAG TPA: hypothetical protein DIC64_01150 [Alphaproteobacteria bacterium]|nr:hypothetical protein [Alphaproteobacteria bacterium]